MGTQNVNKDKKEYDISKQAMGRDPEPKKQDRPLNELSDDEREKKPGSDQSTA